MHSEKNKAVFLDRDGVLNRENGNYVVHLEDFIINKGVVEALRIFQEKKYLLIVITNQGGIAKGICSREQVDYLHHHLVRMLANHGIRLEAIYYCPHHPEITNCICRKPDSLLLEKALARFHIDPAHSYFIGDAERDMEAGAKAGLRIIKTEPNQSLLEISGGIV